MKYAGEGGATRPLRTPATRRAVHQRPGLKPHHPLGFWPGTHAPSPAPTQPAYGRWGPCCGDHDRIGPASNTQGGKLTESPTTTRYRRRLARAEHNRGQGWDGSLLPVRSQVRIHAGTVLLVWLQPGGPHSHGHAMVLHASPLTASLPGSRFPFSIPSSVPSCPASSFSEPMFPSRRSGPRPQRRPGTERQGETPGHAKLRRVVPRVQPLHLL